MKPSTSGYSGTPLAKKLGITPACRVVAVDAPADYLQWLAPLPQGVIFEKKISLKTDLIHLFCDQRAELQKHLVAWRDAIKPDAIVWVSWPKKASKVSTDIIEDTIRELALPLGFVDVKVCAVSEIWSGLKLVIRKALR
jgi:hypothetical protein